MCTIEDVQATKDKVNVEIAKLRAHDSETSGLWFSYMTADVYNNLFIFMVDNVNTSYTLHG